MEDLQSPPPSALQLSPEEMRALGYRVVDRIVAHVAGVRDQAVSGGAPRAEMERRLREPPPEEGRGWEAALERTMADVFGPMSHVDHPRFFAYVPSPGSFVGAMADALVSGLNPFAGAWATAAGAAEVELVAADWLRGLCGLPEGAGGAFVSGGSMANLTALAVARWRRFGAEDFSRAVVYCSDQAHSSIHRAARVLGFRPEQVRVLPADGAYRLPVEELERAAEADRAAGLVPFLAVGSAGTTNTGAVDPLPALAEACRRLGTWMHVDGAYGAPAVLTERGRELLRGIERADSVSLDPHKWLFQPFECACILVRDGGALRDAFRMVPEYLKDSDRAEEEVNFRDWGVQLTRSFRALKLWLSVQVHGLAAFRAAVARGMRLAGVGGGDPGAARHRHLPPRGRGDEGGRGARRAAAPHRYRDGAGRVGDAEHHGAGRPRGAAPVHHQPAHHGRRRARDGAPPGAHRPGAGGASVSADLSRTRAAPHH